MYAVGGEQYLSEYQPEAEDEDRGRGDGLAGTSGFLFSMH